MAKSGVTRAKTAGTAKADKSKKVPVNPKKVKAPKVGEEPAKDSFEGAEDPELGDDAELGAGPADPGDDTFGVDDDQELDAPVSTLPPVLAPVTVPLSKQKMNLHVVEGEYVQQRGRQNEIAPYLESFVLPVVYSVGNSRAIIKKYLIAGRLKTTKEGYRRVRTVSIVETREASAAEVKQYGLQQTNVDKMNFNELSILCAQEGLANEGGHAVIPTLSSTIDEARYKVKKALKGGKRVAAFTPDTDAAPEVGEVDKEGKPLKK